MPASSTPPGVPGAVLEAHAGWGVRMVYQSVPAVATYRLTGPAGRVRYVKVAEVGWTPDLASEGERMRWARAHLPVPRVVDGGGDGAVQWLVTEALPGVDATAGRWRSDSPGLVERLAQGLERFHQAPVRTCPYSLTLDVALAQARRRLAAGEIDPERDFHSEHEHLSAEEAVELLSRNRPPREDLVVCHGDYCLPNILLDGSGVTGFVDLGELGVAGRWWDLAVATWSLTWNLGPGFEAAFLEAYGVEPAARRMEYYRLLYDVVS